MDFDPVRVPPIASRWIAAKLGLSGPDESLAHSGLLSGRVKVADLHRLYSLLRHMPHASVTNRKLYGRKEQIAKKLRDCFYNRNAQEHGVNQRLMQDLLEDIGESSTPTIRAQTPGSIHDQALQQSLQSLQRNVAAQMAHSRQHSSFPLNGGPNVPPFSLTHREIHSPQRRIVSSPPPSSFNWGRPIQQHTPTFAAAATPWGATAPSPAVATAPTPTVKVKTEEGQIDYPTTPYSNESTAKPLPGDPSATPRTPYESNALHQLTQMGFTDREEILTCVRNLASPSSVTPAIDEVMIALVTAREEAEEARKMDEARLRSERSRKEEAARRRHEIQLELEQRMERASLQQLSSDKEFFPRSWILDRTMKHLHRVRNSSTAGKTQLLRILKLERLSRKWYGDLPQAYFVFNTCGQITKCKPASEEILCDLLKKESDILEDALYKLSEQTGSVPKIFISAHDEHGKGLQTPKKGGSRDDEEIMVVRIQNNNCDGKKRPAAAGASSTLSAKRQKRETPATPEIIEIL